MYGEGRDAVVDFLRSKQFLKEISPSSSFLSEELGRFLIDNEHTVTLGLGGVDVSPSFTRKLGVDLKTWWSIKFPTATTYLGGVGLPTIPVMEIPRNDQYIVVNDPVPQLEPVRTPNFGDWFARRISVSLPKSVELKVVVEESPKYLSITWSGFLAILGIFLAVFPAWWSLLKKIFKRNDVDQIKT